MKTILLISFMFLAAGCGNSMVGLCMGDTCGKGQCTEVAQCTSACERVKVNSGDKCPEGYGCLGYVICTNKDFGNPFDLYGADFTEVDLRGSPADFAHPADMAVNSD
jgi:hypothetical protein